MPLHPGRSDDSSRNSSSPGVNSSSSGIRRTVNCLADRVVGQRRQVGFDVVAARDRVAVRARGRLAEQAVHRDLDVLADHVLPLARLVVRLGPRQLQHVGQEAFGQSVPSDDLLGELQPGRR